MSRDKRTNRKRFYTDKAVRRDIFLFPSNPAKVAEKLPHFEYEMRGRSVTSNIVDQVHLILYRWFCENLPPGGDRALREDRHRALSAEFADLYALPSSKPTWLDNYYLDTGAKVTKRLRGMVLNMAIPKDEVVAKWPGVCKEIADLYMPSMTVRGSFSLPKEMLGEGIFETGSTCFGIGGENVHHKVWLMKNHRIRLFMLWDKKDPKKIARCIAFFKGDRTVELMNFYYNRFPENWRIFVDAFKFAFGLPDPDFGRRSGNLPVYLNGDTVQIRCYKRTPAGEEISPGRIALSNYAYCASCENLYNWNAGERYGGVCDPCGDAGENGAMVDCPLCDRRTSVDNFTLVSGRKSFMGVCGYCARSGETCWCCNRLTFPHDVSILDREDRPDGAGGGQKTVCYICYNNSCVEYRWLIDRGYKVIQAPDADGTDGIKDLLARRKIKRNEPLVDLMMVA